MTTKERFLAVKSYEEYVEIRDELDDLDMSDKEIREHIGNVFPKVKLTTEELSKTPGGDIGR